MSTTTMEKKQRLIPTVRKAMGFSAPSTVWMRVMKTIDKVILLQTKVYVMVRPVLARRMAISAVVSSEELSLFPVHKKY